MTDIIEDSFLFLALFKHFGLYQPQKVSFLYKLRFYALCAGFTLFPVILTCVKLFNNLEELALNYTRSYICACINYVFKILLFISQQERILRCLKCFTQDYFRPEGTVQRRIVKNCVRHCKYICYLYMSGVAVVFLTVTIAPLFAKNTNVPLSLWSPSDYTSNNLVFALSYIYVTLGIGYNGICGSMVDVLLSGLAYHGACQLKILNYNLNNLAKRQKNTHERLRDCVIRHKKILSFVNDYQECFSTVIFCHFAGSVGVVVIFMVDLFFVPSKSESSFVSILGSFVVIFQLFFYCYNSEFLLQEHMKLNQSIYLSFWYQYDLQTQKELFMVMERVQIPLILTVGKFVDVKLEVFFKMLRAMYSLVALLHKFQHN